MQVLLVVTAHWQVLCYDHNLQQLWSTQVKVGQPPVTTDAQLHCSRSVRYQLDLLLPSCRRVRVTESGLPLSSSSRSKLQGVSIAGQIRWHAADWRTWTTLYLALASSIV